MLVDCEESHVSHIYFLLLQMITNSARKIPDSLSPRPAQFTADGFRQ